MDVMILQEDKMKVWMWSILTNQSSAPTFKTKRQLLVAQTESVFLVTSCYK